MSIFCEFSAVRVFLVVLVVLFVGGAGVDGAFARIEMQNGHEGDPLDGSDIVGGGGGNQAGDDGSFPVFGLIKDTESAISLLKIDWIFLNDGLWLFDFSPCLGSNCVINNLHFLDFDSNHKD